MKYTIQFFNEHGDVVDTFVLECNVQYESEDIRQIARIHYDACAFIRGFVKTYSIKYEEDISNL